MSRFTLTALAVLALALLLGAFIACGGGDSRDDREERSSSSGSGGQSASDVPSDPEGLIPVDADQAFIFDVSAMLSGDIPGNIEDDFATWADELFDGDIDLGDVDTLVVIDDSLLLAQGSFNFDRIRDTLEDLGYESEEFLGFETWGERAALIEDEDYVMLGFVPGALQEMLESIDRERNLLAYERNSDLSQVVDEVGSGAILYLLPDCGGFPLYGCVAFGTSYSFRGSQSGTARVRAIYLHEDVESAEGTLSLVSIIEQNDSLLNDSDLVDITDARTDGAAVVLEFIVEGDNLSDLDVLFQDGPVARRLGPSSTSRSAPAAPAATVVGRPVSTSSLFPSSSPVLAVASTARPAATSSPRPRSTSSLFPSSPSGRSGGSIRDAGRINPGQVASDRLDSGDSHYYEFDAQRGRTYTIETYAEFDSYLELLDDTEYRIDSDDDGGSGSSSMIQWTADYSGTHFIVVRGYDDDDEGSYELFLTVPDPDDHGGDFANATSINVGGRADGSIGEGDEDYFVFDARRGNAYILETDAGFDTYIELYDEDEYRLASDDDGGEDSASRLMWLAGYSGEHYLKVRGYGSGSAGRYRLTLTLVEPDDHGNSMRSATRVGGNDEVAGTILEDEEDFFRIEVRRGRSYVFETEANFDTYIKLLDDSGSEVGYDDDGGQGGGSLLRWTAPSSGDYFVVVRGYGSGSTGIYRLLISESR